MAKHLSRRGFLQGVAAGSAALSVPALARVLTGSRTLDAALGVQLAHASSTPVDARIGPLIRYNDLYPAHYNTGDTFYAAWASDGTLYINTDDTGGWNEIYSSGDSSDTMLGTLAGDPSNPGTLAGSSFNKMNGQNGAINFGFENSYNGTDNRTWKACTLYAVNGTLYKGVYRQNTSDTPWAQNASIIKSTDGGTTWTNHLGQTNTPPPTDNTCMFPGGQFGLIDFIDYGKDGAIPSPVVDRADLYVSAYSVDASPGTGHNLARVTRTDLPGLDKTKWQFYKGGVGGDGSLDANWSSVLSQATHFFASSTASHGDMVYNQALGCYIWLQYSGGHGDLPVHYRVYQSLHPWGPWTQIRDQTLGALFAQPTTSTKFISADGLTTWILSSGDYLLGDVQTGSYCLYTAELRLSTSAIVEGTYPGGVPTIRPSDLLRAENFDTGGEGVAYHNAYLTNKGGSTYRSGETVSLENCSDTGGGSDLCWNATGNWLKYTTNIQITGAYSLGVRVASTGSGNQFHVSSNDVDLTGKITVPNTGGWQTWQTLAIDNINLTAGQQTFAFVMNNVPSGFNLNYLVFRLPFGSGGGAWPLPGRVRMENFDVGGEGLAYHNSSGINKGGSTYRGSETVSLESCSDTGGGSDLCWNATGNWLQFTVNVTTPGSHTLTARVANGGTTASQFHVEIDGQNVTGSINVAPTLGYQDWHTISAPNPVSLSAGQHVLRVIIDNGTGINLNWIEVS